MTDCRSLQLPQYLYTTRTCAVLLLLSLLVASFELQAEEVIHLKAIGNQTGSTQFSGTVLDYTGTEITIQLESGKILTYPGERVAKIDKQYHPTHLQANEFYQKRNFAVAREQYQQALRGEKRVWVRREILAQQVRCYQQLEQHSIAVELFLQLIASDPQTPYFDCIPLAWTPKQSVSVPQTTASKWATQGETPTEQLLGASYLLASSTSAALTKLNQLIREEDPRILWLAQTQIWRKELPVSTLATVERWNQALDRIPQELRAGPLFVVGSAWHEHGNFDWAAIRLMQVPILYPENRLLAAHSLDKAGRTLEKANRPLEAAEIFRSILKDYADFKELKQGASQKLSELSQASK